MGREEAVGFWGNVTNREFWSSKFPTVILKIDYAVPTKMVPLAIKNLATINKHWADLPTSVQAKTAMAIVQYIRWQNPNYVFESEAMEEIARKLEA